MLATRGSPSDKWQSSLASDRCIYHPPDFAFLVIFGLSQGPFRDFTFSGVLKQIQVPHDPFTFEASHANFNTGTLETKTFEETAHNG